MDEQALLKSIEALLDAKLGSIKEDIEFIKGDIDFIKGDIDFIKGDIDFIKEDIEFIKEDAAITRNGVNVLLDWAEQAQIEVKIPLYKKAE